MQAQEVHYMNHSRLNQSLIAAILLLGVSFANAKANENLPQPENGDLVCQAYISEYQPYGDRLAGHMQMISNLPEHYCRNGRALDGSLFSMFGRRLRVVAVGDFYQYSKDSSEASPLYVRTVKPKYSQVVCNARALTPEGELVSLSNLQEASCFTGATFRIKVNKVVRWVRIEAAYDFHYAPEDDVQFAKPEKINPYKAPLEEVMPASYGVEI